MRKKVAIGVAHIRSFLSYSCPSYFAVENDFNATILEKEGNFRLIKAIQQTTVRFVTLYR